MLNVLARTHVQRPVSEVLKFPKPRLPTSPGLVYFSSTSPGVPSALRLAKATMEQTSMPGGSCPSYRRQSPAWHLCIADPAYSYTCRRRATRSCRTIRSPASAIPNWYWRSRIRGSHRSGMCRAAADVRIALEALKMKLVCHRSMARATQPEALPKKQFVRVRSAVRRCRSSGGHGDCSAARSSSGRRLSGST